MNSRDANSKKAASEATAIFQNYYPEFLVCPFVSFLSTLHSASTLISSNQYKKFFVNVPAVFTWIFWLFKPLISAATRARRSVVGSGARTIGAELSQVIPAEELPKKYGGQADAEDF